MNHLDHVCLQKSSIRKSRGWSLQITQLILEVHDSCTLPSSINTSIVAFVTNVATKVVIQELSSILFIWHCRTVLLVVCQLLAAYRLSKSEGRGSTQWWHWSLWQTDIINMIITVARDNCPQYLLIIFAASIIPEDGVSTSIYDSIVNFLEEKKE